MRWQRFTVTLALGVFVVAPLKAQQNADIGQQLFPPEMVLQNQAAIGLSNDQQASINKAVGEMQASVATAKARVQGASVKLRSLLSEPRVDANAALEQVDSILGVEREVNRSQFVLMIKVKNILTPEQQAKLNQLRK